MTKSAVIEVCNAGILWIFQTTFALTLAENYIKIQSTKELTSYKQVMSLASSSMAVDKWCGWAF